MMLLNFILSGLKKFLTPGFGIVGLYLLQTIQFFEYSSRMSKNSVSFSSKTLNTFLRKLNGGWQYWQCKCSLAFTFSNFVRVLTENNTQTASDGKFEWISKQ